MYLHHLLNSNESSLAKQVLMQQTKKPLKSDWITSVKIDVDQIKVKMSFEEIASFSKSN